MTAIKNHILKILSIFPTTTHDQDSDLKFILSNSLILQICNFLEEFGYLGRCLKSCGNEWILKVLAPLYAPIKESATIRELRSRNIAHGHRDNNGQPTYALQVMLENKIPQHYAEILFLGYCVANFVLRLRSYLIEEFEEAERKYKDWVQPIFEKSIRQAQEEIKSTHEIKEKIEKLLREVDARERELSKNAK